MKIKSVRGMHDVFGQDMAVWSHIEQIIRQVYTRAGYREIRTPILESTDLFLRGVGETSDIVNKEMYTFMDRGGDSVTMRPEGTAPVVRAAIENGLIQPGHEVKLFYIGPMFRYERPQKGRQRQFHQYGIEHLNTSSAFSDAEVIALQSLLYREIGLLNCEVEISSVGCQECRQAYEGELKKALQEKIAQVPENFRPRIDSAPMRIFDQKDEGSQKLSETLPTMLQYLCEQCLNHFEQVKRHLKNMDTQFKVNPKIVRGLDYYNSTAFEVKSSHLGSQSALGGGGRYDGLFEDLGANPTASVGFAGGLERLVIAYQATNTEKFSDKTDVFVLCADEPLRDTATEIYWGLLKRGLQVTIDHEMRSFKSQIKKADKAGARYVVILGEREWQEGKLILKDFASGDQIEVPVGDKTEIASEISKKLKL
ncbi:MAG: histidine--tRNA ligase [Bdellovibrionales bacterium CG10_big_fil_rev_8_21_14_0_10_45_34]|nr:MAG: histidine--tRNA ligase [Bdellovibrionales bacterium CG10_big_fil_rev_8_21_14_0_10_45_34]